MRHSVAALLCSTARSVCVHPWERVRELWFPENADGLQGATVRGDPEYVRQACKDSKASIQAHGQDAPDTAQSIADLTAFVQNLLHQMQSRFQTMSDSFISKIGEMGTRIEDLEKSIGDLVKEDAVEPGLPSRNHGLHTICFPTLHSRCSKLELIVDARIVSNTEHE